MNAAARMDAVDRAWLLMERRTNPMMVVALIVLERPLALAALRARVAERFLRHERFRMRPECDPLGATWRPCEHFDPADHVVAVTLPAPAARRQLEKLLGALASTPLDPGRPLWSFHLVERYRRGSALILRIHHCYADGIALVRVFLSLTDAGVERTTAPARAAASSSAAPAARALQTIEAWYKPVAGAVEDTIGRGARILDRALHLTLHPAEALRTAQEAAGLATELARIALLPDDPSTRLRRPLSGAKRTAWAEPVPLEEVAGIARALGCTVNDVLMATLAGALGRYLDSAGDAVDGLALRAAVPVNLRSGAPEEPALGNRFGLVFVELPIGLADPVARISALHATMQALRGSAQPLLTLGLLAVVGSLPAIVEQPALELLSAKASLVVSNVPGPREALALAGVPMSQVLFWVPQAGSLGVGVSLLTYRGQLQFGVIADRGLIPEPRRLVGLLAEELERLVMFVLLGSDAAVARATDEITSSRASPASRVRARRRASALHRPAPARPRE